MTLSRNYSLVVHIMCFAGNLAPYAPA